MACGLGPDVVSGTTARRTCLKVLSIRSNVTEFASFSLSSAVSTDGHERTHSLRRSGRSISLDSSTATMTFSAETLSQHGIDIDLLDI